MHLLLDVLLTDRGNMALRKIALATQEARSDIRFTADHMRRFTADGFNANRRRCLHFARRTHHDEGGLDLLWRMLAACPQAVWTYGFMDRLTQAFNLMHDQLLEAEEGLLHEATERFERWEFIAAGFPALGDDPFLAVTPEKWRRAQGMQSQREKDERRADDVAQLASKSIQNLAPTNFDDLESTKLPQDVQQEVSAGVTVIAGEPKLAMPYKALVDCQTPLTMTPALRPIRDVLRAEFPHALSAIDLMLGDLRPDQPLRFRPFLLLGSAGCGKSRLIRRLCELLNVKVMRHDGAGSSDNAFGGTPKRWTSATPCVPLQAVAHAKVANPVVFIDEVDKSGHSTAGSLSQALMPFLERETAMSYPDPCFEIECDLSHVNFALTANDDNRLPSPLRDRLRVIRVPSPTVEHLDALAKSIMVDLAAEMNVPAAFLTALAPDELMVVRKAWGETGSVRKLQKIIRGTISARDQHASRH